MITQPILALPRGVTIICPACGLRIATVIKALYRGQVIRAENFKPLVPNVEHGEGFKCIKCSADYFLMGKFYIEDLGWMPNY